MNRTIDAVALLLVVFSWSAGAVAASVEFSLVAERGVEIFDLHPFESIWDRYKFFVSTDADLLSINQVLVTSIQSLFQVAPPFGSNTEPPDPLFVQLLRALALDSWITTPGDTVLLGGDIPGDGTGTWGDLSDDGSQSNFQFAQLSFPTGTTGRFTGRVSVAGSTGPENFPFDFLIVPEPATSGLAAMTLLALAAIRRTASAAGARQSPLPTPLSNELTLCGFSLAGHACSSRETVPDTVHRSHFLIAQPSLVGKCTAAARALGSRRPSMSYNATPGDDGRRDDR